MKNTLALLVLTLGAQPTALDRYVAQKDDVYAWRLIDKSKAQAHTTYILELTSQAWRSAKDVDKPVWKHWLTITKPDKLIHNKAILNIGAGSNTDPAPVASSARSIQIATQTNAVVADLAMVPNQPLRFTDSPETPRSEDDLIAYTRVKHFSTKDDSWLVRLAMVKSGVRAMDAIQAFLKTEQIDIRQFIVAGGSKRGWTTWLIGAVDPRVAAIIPIVIDALNSEAVTKHHFEVLGYFSPALRDYVNHGLFPHKIGTPEYRAVLAVEDPFNYRHRPALKMPKLLINASGDQFFLPDNSRFYYGELPEEKYLRYVPNAKHNLAGSDSVNTIIAFCRSILNSTDRPKFTTKKYADGTVTVTTKSKPLAVSLWQATNPKARDFRVDVIGNAYKSTALSPQPNGSFTANVPKPESGFTAWFIELTFPGDFKLTTEVSVTPDTLPHQWSEAAVKYAAPK